MPWPAVAAVGGLLGGMGQLAGGVSGMFGGKGQDDSDARDWARYYAQETPSWRKEGAVKAGYHPLAAMGMNPAGGPVAKGGTGKGSALANMGQGIERMSKAGESEIQKAQARKLNLEADLIALQIKKDSPTGQGGSGIAEENLPLKHPAYSSTDQKSGAAVKALYQLYRHPDNSIIKIPSEDAADYLSESVVDSAMLQTKRWWNNLTKKFGRVSGAREKSVRKELNDMEDFMRANGELREDEYMQFSAQLGLPIVTRYTGGSKTLYRGTTSVFKKNKPRYTGMYHRKNKPFIEKWRKIQANR